MKPAVPHVVVALSCFLPYSKSIAELVLKHFSPFPYAQTEGLDGYGNSASATLIHVLEEAILDSNLKHIPKNTALFLSMPPEWQQSSETVRALQEHLQEKYSADLTIMIYANSQESISEALNWLDRAECELAFVLSLDNIAAQNAAAAILIASANAARSNRLKPYANLQQASAATELNPSSVSLLEVCNKDWLDSFQPAEAVEQKRINWIENEKTGIWSKHDKICYASGLAFDAASTSSELAPLLAIASAALALHLRVIPGSKTNLLTGNTGRIVQSSEARPWIHPLSPIEAVHPRRALLCASKQDWLLTENGNDIDQVALRKIQKQTSELFIFAGDSVESLIGSLEKVSTDKRWQTAEAKGFALHELAYINNIVEHNSSPDAIWKLAIVTSSKSQLLNFIAESIAHLSSSPATPLNPGAVPTGIYYSASPAIKPGKLAFLLSGLGAAYPQMLQDLCFYFPEFRQVFDFVERMALRAEDKIIPSRTLFPLVGSKHAGSSQAMLATMDSAVVTLLLAEWAIFVLLKKLGVCADAFIGVSTGEFAAICMSESVNVIEAAETFYRLSTEVSRSIPLKSLSDLRTVRVAASYEKTLAPILEAMTDPIYVGADLSESCVLLSGQKKQIEDFCAILRRQEIDFLLLPVAIPYHTPIVAGKVSDQDDDVQALQMSSPQIEAWSCSSSSLYPQDSNSLRKISTDLFEKPIQLRKTLLKCYEAGSRIFVEVAPKGGLVPFISEVLKGKEHVAIAANLQSRTGIDQFNVMLALLTCNGIDTDLQYLYKRRINTEDFKREAVAPESAAESLQMSDSLYEFMQWSDTNPDTLISDLVDPEQILQGFQKQSMFNPQPLLDLQALMNQQGPMGLDLQEDFGLNNEVMLTYLSTMQQFHSSLMNTQERMMLAYMQASEEEAIMREFETLSFPQNYAFLPDPAIQTYEGCFQVQFTLSTAMHPFLLDHAIGGAISSCSETSRVYLLPLMVALEIMAEGASLVFPQLELASLRDIRAYKRIQVEEGKELKLVLELRVPRDHCVEARICLPSSDSEETQILAAGLAEFAQSRPASPEPWQLAFNDARASILSPDHLYEKQSMFHGPRMQSVCSIDRVSKRQIEGQLRCRIPEDWFANQNGNNPPMVTNPLLIDNASQFVLYQMYEHKLPAIALLPFHIDSIEFFAGFADQFGQTLKARAQLLSMNSRGTEARVELQDPAGNVIARVNEVSSRAIMLSKELTEFIHDPRLLICRRLELDENDAAVIAAVDRAELPEDETTLDWLSDYLLKPGEQNEWRKIGRSARRKLDWLSGRVAAKDALRIYLRENFNLRLNAADIEIGTASAGNAELVCLHGADACLKQKIQISISHCQTSTVAIAEAKRSDRQAGVDTEDIVEREDGFTQLSFTPAEQKWLEGKPASQQAKYISLLWSAKEATAKACGTGLMGDPKNFQLQSEEAGIYRIISPAEKGLNGQTRSESRVYSCRVLADNERKLTLAYVVDSQE